MIMLSQKNNDHQIYDINYNKEVLVNMLNEKELL